MYIYSNNNRDILIDINDHYPNGNPDYVISVNELHGLIINGQPVKPLVNTKLVDDLIFESANVITEPNIIELNSKTISCPNDTAGDGVFHVTSGGSLIINGEGVINGVGNNDYNMAIWADGGNVIINNGTFTNAGATATNDPAHFDLIYAKNGSIVEINGGTFICETPQWTLNLNDSKPGSIVVRGGKFYKFNPAEANTEPGGPVNFVAPGYKVTKDGDYYIVSK